MAIACSLYPEIVLVEPRDAGDLLLGQIRCVGCRGELLELLLVVDVWQGRGYLWRGEGELQGGLPQGTLAGVGQEGELLDLLEAVEEPLPRAVAPVVVLGEGSLFGVLALQHTRGVGDPDDQARSGLSCDLDQAAPRVLLEEVVDHLHAREVSLAHSSHALLEPADLGSESDAVGADLAFPLELLQELEERIVLYGIHLGVVKLEEVYVVGSEPLQALLQREADKFLRPVLRALLLAAAGRVGVKVLAHLCRDDPP